MLKNIIASGCLPGLSVEDANILKGDPEGLVVFNEYMTAARECLNGEDLTGFLFGIGAEILLEYIGWNDIKTCLSEGNVGACLWSVVDVVGLVLPFLKGDKIVKAIAAVVANIGKWIAKSERIAKIAEKALSILSRLKKFCTWFSVFGTVTGGASVAEGGPARASSAATMDFPCGEVRYDSDYLSTIAFLVRDALGVHESDRNIAVAYVEGFPGESDLIHRLYPNIVIGVSSRNGNPGYHSEDDIIDQLKRAGVSPKKIDALYSERAPCDRCAGRLKGELSEKAKVSWTLPYGKTLSDRKLLNKSLADFIADARRRHGLFTMADESEDVTGEPVYPVRRPAPSAPLAVAAVSARQERRS